MIPGLDAASPAARTARTTCGPTSHNSGIRVVRRTDEAPSLDVGGSRVRIGYGRGERCVASSGGHARREGRAHRLPPRPPRRVVRELVARVRRGSRCRGASGGDRWAKTQGSDAGEAYLPRTRASETASSARSSPRTVSRSTSRRLAVRGVVHYAQLEVTDAQRTKLKAWMEGFATVRCSRNPDRDRRRGSRLSDHGRPAGDEPGVDCGRRPGGARFGSRWVRRVT